MGPSFTSPRPSTMTVTTKQKAEHPREAVIQKLGRTPQRSPDWTSLSERYFLEAKPDEAIWPSFQPLRDNRLNRKDALFWIEFSHDANLMVYTAKMRKDKLQDVSDPIWYHWWQIDKAWINKKGNRKNPLVDLAKVEGLKGWIVHNTYGVTQTKKSDTSVSMKLHKLPDNLSVKVQYGRAKALTTLNGRTVWLTYIFIQTKWGGTYPEWVLFMGQDVRTGEKIVEIRDASGNVLPR